MICRFKISRLLKFSLAAVLTILIAVWILFAKLKPNTKAKTLKIGVMPDLDSIQVAVALSYCENVEIVLFTDALSRSAAFRSGAIDLCVSDLLTAISEITNGRNDKILTTTSGRYCLVSTKSQIEQIDTVGISSGTVIEYTTDLLFNEKTVEKIPISSISARASALKNRNISAAVLPEPFATFTLSSEIKILAEYNEENIGIISCNEKAYQKKQPQITEFLKAFNKAADVIAASPDSEIVKSAMQSLSIGEAFGRLKLPSYRYAALPDDTAIISACEYLSKNGICTPDRNAVNKALST